MLRDEGVRREQSLAYLRENAEDAETIFYVYVTEPDGRLVGVFSLQDLVLAKPRTPVDEFMHDRFVSVHPSASQEEVAEIVGIPENTVKTRLFYARKKLAELLKAAGIERGWP